MIILDQQNMNNVCITADSVNTGLTLYVYDRQLNTGYTYDAVKSYENQRYMSFNVLINPSIQNDYTFTSNTYITGVFISSGLTIIDSGITVSGGTLAIVNGSLQMNTGSTITGTTIEYISDIDTYQILGDVLTIFNLEYGRYDFVLSCLNDELCNGKLKINNTI